ncbi:MAG: hypothetical protein ACRD28_09120 [Acidobacteriaceae bacterium]
MVSIIYIDVLSRLPSNPVELQQTQFVYHHPNISRLPSNPVEL